MTERKRYDKIRKDSSRKEQKNGTAEAGGEYLPDEKKMAEIRDIPHAVSGRRGG